MKALIKDLVETLILAFLLFLLLQVSIQNFRIFGSSMEPSLFDGQYILVNKLAYFRIPVGWFSRALPFLDAAPNKKVALFHPPRRGDVVVFPDPTNPRRDVVKRVIAAPGDTVEMREGQVYLNGKPLEESYKANVPDTSSFPPLRVPKDHYFVMGDNRRVSNDSRVWGPIPSSSVIGRAWVSYWPLTEMGFLTVARGINPGTRN
ncbi:MAG: signal peptidase I [Chloroflexi bacterium]|nr:signal peptidase I [Chloroflexota bacterium]